MLESRLSGAKVLRVVWLLRCCFGATVLKVQRRCACVAGCRGAVAWLPLWLRLRPAAGRAARRRRHAVHGRRRSARARALRGAVGGRVPGRSRSTASALPPVLVAATLAAEDRRFYSHPGVDPVSLAARGAAEPRRATDRRGGSTITQQVAKLLIQRREGIRPRGFRAKIREMVLALRLEHRFSKREILALYLNLASYGNQATGAGRASQIYFGVDASMLTPAQAAFLAALPQRPTAFNPWKNLASAARAPADGAAPHGGGRHADRRAAARSARRTGGAAAAAHGASTRRISSRWSAPSVGGQAPSRIETTLDLDLQREVERIVEHERASLKAHGAANAAVVVLDNATGRVAGVGGLGRLWRRRTWRRDQRPAGAAAAGFRAEAVHLRARVRAGARRRRRCCPTSRRTFRPRSRACSTVRATTTAGITVRCSRAGRSPVRRTFPRSRSRPTSASARCCDSSSRRAHHLRPHAGVLRARADARQRGSPARRTRRRLCGVRARRRLAAADVSSSGWSRVASAFRWKNGRWSARRPRSSSPTSSAIPRRARSRFGRGSDLDFPFPWRSKTGTSQAYHDNWTIGYTRDVTVGVWVGNFDRTPLRNSSGVTGAGPIFHAVMLAATTGPRVRRARTRSFRRRRASSR